MIVKTTASLVAPPLGFLALSALDVGQWEFAKAAVMGALLGTCARFCMAMYQGEVRSKKGALGLVMASFFIGLAGPYIWHLFAELRDLNSITGAAALCSLFAILIEMITRQHLKHRAEALSSGVPVSRLGSSDDITGRMSDHFPNTSEEKAEQGKTNPD